MLKLQIYTEEVNGFGEYHLVVGLSLCPIHSLLCAIRMLFPVFEQIASCCCLVIKPSLHLQLLLPPDVWCLPVILKSAENQMRGVQCCIICWLSLWVTRKHCSLFLLSIVLSFLLQSAFPLYRSKCICFFFLTHVLRIQGVWRWEIWFWCVTQTNALNGPQLLRKGR